MTVTDFEDVFLGLRAAMPSEQPLSFVRAALLTLLRLRSAIVMNPDRGGAFDMLLKLVRYGLGGRAGNGRQFVSWIHDQDLLRSVSWLIEHEKFDGPVNLSSPNPLTNSEFMQALRAAWGTRFGLPATDWIVEIGAFLLRTETELILNSRRVHPDSIARVGICFSVSEVGGGRAGSLQKVAK